MPEEDFKPLAAQRRSSRIQRTAWLLMGILLLVAFAGGFGQGPLSHARVRSADGRFEMRYDRQRHGIERLEQIHLAVLERRGVISIIPATGARS